MRCFCSGCCQRQPYLSSTWNDKWYQETWTKEPLPKHRVYWHSRQWPMRNEKLKRQAWPWPLHMMVPDCDGKRKQEGLLRRQWILSTAHRDDKMQEDKGSSTTGVQHRVPMIWGGYPYSCRGLSSEGTLRKRPLEQCTVQYLLLLQSFADQRNQKSQGIGSSTQECLACSSQGNQPYTMCTLYSCRKSEKQDSPKQVLSKGDLTVSEQSLRIVMKHETLSTQQLQRLAMH